MRKQKPEKKKAFRPEATSTAASWDAFDDMGLLCLRGSTIFLYWGYTGVKTFLKKVKILAESVEVFNAQIFK